MPITSLAVRLRERLDRLGAPCSEHQAQQLAGYIGLLTKWNKTVNLTALRLDPLSDEAIDRLIAEPFLAAGVVAESHGQLLDLGSGGGSPAIPLKIALPHLRLTMVESRVRKSAFLREAIRHLALDGSEVQTARIEELQDQPAFRGAAELVSIRAVRLDDEAWSDIAPLVAAGGSVLWFRTEGDVATEFARPFTINAPRQLIPGSRSELVLIRRSV